MQYLSKRNIIHRDLAARNLLVKKEEDDFIAKVADFGMSRSLYEKEYYISEGGKPFAYKWAAPEVITNRRFSTASDVFSFGVVLWEMLEYGKGNQHWCSYIS